MAIGANIRDEVTVILQIDSALPQDDKGAEAYERYYEDGFNEKHIAPLMNGTRPTRFTLRRLSYDARKRCDEIESAPERSDFVIRATLRKVDNFELIHDGGRITTLRQPDFEDVQPFGAFVTRKWMNEANMPSNIINTLAAVGRLLSEGKIPFVGCLSTHTSEAASGEKSASEKSATD